jgi:hypothetical protein
MGFTKSYSLSDNGAALLDGCASEQKITRMVNEEGVYIRTPAVYGILSTDTNSRNRKGKGNIPALVKIDRDALEELRLMLRQQKEAYMEYLQYGIPPPACEPLQARLDGFCLDVEALAFLRMALNQINSLLSVVDADYLPRNTLECQYQEYPSGRLFASGMSLQNLVREIRRAALRGGFEFDISNCHPAIVVQMAEQVGRDMPAVKRYLDKKKEIRETIARDVGISKDHAKQALLSIFYGVRRSVWNEAAIPKLIGLSKAQALYAHPDWSGLVDEVRSVKKLLLSRGKRNRGLLVNAMGKTLKGTPDEEFAHCVQGCEAACLNAVIEVYGEHLTLLQHDGFTSRVRLDVSEIEDVIYQKTGFRLTIEPTPI